MSINSKLTKTAGTSPGIVVGTNSKYPQVANPITIERMAPAGLDLRQYNPAIIGTNNETRLKIDEPATPKK